MPFFICVHVGAGYHATEKERSYRRLMCHACRAASDVLTSKADLAQAVTEAISMLEDSELTNAGHGSNLNYDGEVECDASIMTGTGLFGAVGAASGVQNPIRAACRLAKLSEQPMAFGRVRPIFLAGDGVRQWALRQGLKGVEDKSAAGSMHVTEDARSHWKRYREMLNSGETTPIKRTLNDTVGCIVVNAAGEVCSGVSSGGIALKTPGRVGEAAIYGAGCWAHNAERRSDSSVACSVSGVGEIVTRGLIARSCAESLTKTTPLDYIKDVIQAHTTDLADPKDVGVISVRTTATRRKGHAEMHVELCVVHNSESMGFAYLTSNSKTAVRFLRQDSNNGSVAEYGACTKWPVGETT